MLPCPHRAAPTLAARRAAALRGMPTHLLLRAVFGGAAFVAAPSGAAPPDRFDAPWIGYDVSTYPTGIDGASTRTADFDDDGVEDLAVVSWYANPVLAILMGDGAGGYRPATLHPLALGSADLEVGDFDADGDVDVVVALTGQVWEGAFVQIWRNDGEGGFVEGFIADSGPGPNELAAGDFDGDGVLDLAVAHDAYIEYANTFAVLRGDGFGGFRAPVIYTTVGGTNAIAAGDLDGDGDLDLAVGHENNKLTIARNNGAGGFANVSVLAGGTSGFLGVRACVEIADVDLDGDNDVLYGHNSAHDGNINHGAIFLYRNDAEGTLAPAQALLLAPWSGGAIDALVTEITGDGVPDVLVASGGATWHVLAGDARGGFAPAETRRAGHGPASVEAVDLDRDGDRDVVVLGSASLEACVYRNPGAGDFPRLPRHDMVDPALGPVSFSNLAAGDVDGDGDLDVAVGWSANFAEVYGVALRLNQGDGTFAPVVQLTAPVFPAFLRLRDLDADGDLDLLWLEGGFTLPHRVRVRRNDGTGTYGAIETYGSTTADPLHVDAYDVDGDDDLDVLVGIYGQVLVARNTGAGFAPFLVHGVGGATAALTCADFDRNGTLDLITGSGVQGYAQISFGNGNGTFGTPFTLPTGRDLHALTVADFDGDGFDDFAGHFNLDMKGLTVRRGRGDGGFFAPVSYHGSYFADDGWSSVAAGDQDGDGAPDAVIGGERAQEIAFWPGLGDGTFAPAERYGVEGVARDIAHGDFDGDGVRDVAVLVEGTSPTNGWYFPSLSILCGRAAAVPSPADLDGDGAVGFSDLMVLLAAWGPCDGCVADLDGSGVVGLDDLLILLANWN